MVREALVLDVDGNMEMSTNMVSLLQNMLFLQMRVPDIIKYLSVHVYYHMIYTIVRS